MGNASKDGGPRYVDAVTKRLRDHGCENLGVDIKNRYWAIVL